MDYGDFQDNTRLKAGKNTGFGDFSLLLVEGMILERYPVRKPSPNPETNWKFKEPAMNGDQKFLVRVENTRFFAEADGRDIRITDTPSFAKHMSYVEADQVCQRLRRHYRMCVVTNCFGGAMTFDQIQFELRQIAEEQAAQEKDALPTNLAELSKIPAAELKRRFKSDPTFAARANEIWHGKGEAQS